VHQAKDSADQRPSHVSHARHLCRCLSSLCRSLLPTQGPGPSNRASSGPAWRPALIAAGTTRFDRLRPRARARKCTAHCTVLASCWNLIQGRRDLTAPGPGLRNPPGSEGDGQLRPGRLVHFRQPTPCASPWSWCDTACHWVTPWPSIISSPSPGPLWGRPTRICTRTTLSIAAAGSTATGRLARRGFWRWCSVVAN